MDKIQVVYEKEKTADNSGANSISGGNTAGAQWFVNYRSEILNKNTLITPDGFASIIFENIGDDPCSILDMAVNPESRAREFLNGPGELFSSRIPVSFGGKSENKQLLVIKIYYEKI